MIKEPKCLIFDFGNVVALFDHNVACNRLAEMSTNGSTATRVQTWIFGFGESDDTPEAKYDLGDITTKKFVSDIKKQFGILAKNEKVEEAWSNIFSPNETIIDLIPRIRSMSYRLILASNTNEMHYDWFSPRFSETLDCFHVRVLSFKINWRKPHEEFFRECLKRARCKASRCVYIDDDENYVEAAQKLGMIGLRYTSTEKLLRELGELGIPIILPKGNTAQEKREGGLAIYNQKYDNFRHFDKLRWQIPALVFASAAVIVGLAREQSNFHWEWILAPYGVFVLLCKRLMSRIRINMNRNTRALHCVAVNIGDYSIPDSPRLHGAAVWVEVFIWSIGIVSILLGGLLLYQKYASILKQFLGICLIQ